MRITAVTMDKDGQIVNKDIEIENCLSVRFPLTSASHIDVMVKDSMLEIRGSDPLILELYASNSVRIKER